MKKHTKYIFVSGGVLSGLGKGVTASALGFLLQKQGLKVTNIKCENYLNLDSGNINPIEHGDVFLCQDGLEADLDLGTYERFLNQEVGKLNFITMGQVYSEVIKQTQDLKFQGSTVDAIPYIPEEIIKNIKKAAKKHDVIMIELGGTAGEYQNIVYYEAYRIMKLRHPDDVIHIHVTYFPNPSHLNELKSKPTQLSVRWLNSMGIQPDFIVGRAESEIDKKRKEKVAFYCNLNTEDVISNPDLQSIYQLPLIFAKQNFDKKVLEKLNLATNEINLEDCQKLVAKITNKKKNKVKVAIIAKYFKSGAFELKDSYASLIESLNHASWANDVDLKIKFVEAEKLEENDQKSWDKIKSCQGVVVPIGWGSRGVEGKIQAIKYVRENKIPFLGLCYGMQLATIEFSRNVVGLKDANTIEVNPKTKNPIIHDIPFNEKYQTIKGDGASMRLGAFDCLLKKDTLAYKIYQKYDGFKNQKKDLISERHRHRFEFNNDYRQILQDHGMIFSGTSPDDFFVEMIELSQDEHPFFLATQAHPEYKSRPMQPHPIFLEFLNVCLKNRK
jgi:CTP synthase